MLTSRTATATKATQIPMSTATPCLQTVTVDMHMGGRDLSRHRHSALLKLFYVQYGLFAYA